MYRTIDAAFWTDPKVRQLTPTGRLLLLYFITNPHTHVSGIYYLPRSTIAHETGLPLGTVNTLCDTLSEIGFCGYDAKRELIWVKNMMRYQGRGEQNLKSAAHHLREDLHNSPLIWDFVAKYPAVKPMLNDRVSDRVFDSDEPVALLNPDQDQDQDQDPFPQSGSILKNSPFLHTPPLAEKRGGKADAAADLFSAAFQRHRKIPYRWKKGDFEQLADLRKRLHLDTRATPDDWELAVENYFDSPLKTFSLRHLATDFDTFLNSRLDRYMKPVNHPNGGANGQPKSRADITRENAENLLRDLENQRGVQRGLEPRDPRNLRK